METRESEGVFIRKKIEPLMLVSFLEIRAARSSDSGDYVCRSSNGDHAAVNVHILNGESPSNQHCHCSVEVGEEPHSLVSSLLFS